MKVQKTYDEYKDSSYVLCGKCGEPVRLRSAAYFDPYNKKFNWKKTGGCYVHHKCLSQKRLDEIAAAIAAEKATANQTP